MSAKREHGKTSFIRIKSLAGEPLKVKTSLHGKVKAKGKRRSEIKELGNGVVSVNLKKNESVILYTGKLPELTIKPTLSTTGTNHWGLHNR